MTTAQAADPVPPIHTEARTPLAELGLPWELYNFSQLEWYGRVNLLKGGMAFADARSCKEWLNALPLTGLYQVTVTKAGFAEGVPDDLPPARREKYEQSGRNSKVLVKKLN
jgi:hypothetical protein